MNPVHSLQILLSISHTHALFLLLRAVFIFDRYYQNKGQYLVSGMIQLITVAIFISAKYEEVDVPKPITRHLQPVQECQSNFSKCAVTLN